MKHDVDLIKKSGKIMVKADKTRNIYEVPKESYLGLRKNQVTSTYKLDREHTVDNINRESYLIAKKLRIEDRVGKMIIKPATLLFKDHKNNFNVRNKLPSRLLNPSKSEIGRISKRILDDINTTIRKKTQHCQWICTNDTINWFNALKGKNKATFLQFDIMEYFPSISEKTFDEAISYAKRFAKITDDDVHIIKHGRRTNIYLRIMYYTRFAIRII